MREKKNKKAGRREEKDSREDFGEATGISSR